MKIIDTHTHGYFAHYDDDQSAMFDRAREAGIVSQIHIGCDEISSLAALNLAQNHDDFFATVGFHPTDVKNIGKEIAFRTKGFENHTPVVKKKEDITNFLENLVKKNPAKIVGIGECGFDFYHDKLEDYYDIQREVFMIQCDLAEKHNLPLVIHTRDADKQLIEFFAQYIAGKNLRGVIHCFSGDLAMAKLFTETHGFYLGVGGIITYNKSTELREIIAEIPAIFLLTETDAPFLPPHQWRKKESRNEPASLPEIVAKIAEVKNIPVAEMALILERNARDLFAI